MQKHFGALELRKCISYNNIVIDYLYLDKREQVQMCKIHVKHNIPYEAICFIRKRLFGHKQWMFPNQIAEIERLNAQLPEDFDDDCIDMSALCLIISAFTDNCLNTLDDLIAVFSDAEQLDSIVRTRIESEFTASYTFPVLDQLKNGMAEQYVKKLSILKRIGLEEQYNERILPLVLREKQKIEQEIAAFDTRSLFNNISKLKNEQRISDASVFVSFFSAPVAFTLYGGSFLTCFGSSGSVDFYSLIAHEKMHGFADHELIELYEDYISKNPFLCETHRSLIRDYQSGDEEEFVNAAEYYLCLRAGRATKEELLKKAKKRYDGVCPVSVILFDLLSREKEIPRDYNGWLKKQFTDGNLPVNHVKEYVSAL